MQVSDIVVRTFRRRCAGTRPSIAPARAVSLEEYLQGLRDAGLQEVEVLEQVVYSGTLLQDFVQSELPANQRSCFGSEIGTSGSLEGRVWSVRFAARKA